MVKEQFLGSWKLVSCEFRSSNGRVSYPLGKQVKGLAIYDSNGYVSVQLLNHDRPAFKSRDNLKGTPEEIKAAFEGCITYYGTYEIKEQERMVMHYVEGSSFPNWEGQVFPRYYEFAGDCLTLSSPPMRIGGEKITGVFVWQRAKPAGEKPLASPS